MCMLVISYHSMHSASRLKHRAATLVQRYAGSHWRDAQRTGWIIDVVTHIDKDYREYILEQV